MISVIVFSIVGFLLSGYAYRIGQLAGKKKNFNALCDINEAVSCSKAFSSEYAHHLGASNAFWGMLFYTGTFVLGLLSEGFYLFVLTTLGVIASVYLAYMLFARLRITCVVCVMIHLVNLILFFLSYRAVFA